jgi:uncharacterized protein YdeI (YjbR/CyaY-like superfamily)
MKIIFFNNVKEFNNFLDKNHDTSPGIWIKFDKCNTQDKLPPDQALQVALNYGWIDGQIKHLDDDFYLKYFTKRLPKSIWSTRNKKIAEELIKSHEMNTPGQAQIDLAKKDGRWERSDSLPEDFSLDNFKLLLQTNQKALQNYLSMSPSIKKTYAISYYSLKKPESRHKRLTKIIERLLENKPPM